MADNGKQVARYVYNPDGTIAKLIVGEDIVTEYGYDTDKNNNVSINSV